jgi:hypothetical protein
MALPWHDAHPPLLLTRRRTPGRVRAPRRRGPRSGIDRDPPTAAALARQAGLDFLHEAKRGHVTPRLARHVDRAFVRASSRRDSPAVRLTGPRVCLAPSASWVPHRTRASLGARLCSLLRRRGQQLLAFGIVPRRTTRCIKHGPQLPCGLGRAAGTSPPAVRPLCDLADVTWRTARIPLVGKDIC